MILTFPNWNGNEWNIHILLHIGHGRQKSPQVFFGIEQSFHPQIFLIEDSRLAFVFKTNLVISATFDPVIIWCFSCHTFS